MNIALNESFLFFHLRVLNLHFDTSLLGNGTQTQLNNNHKRGTQSTKHRDDAMTVTKDINVENPIMGKTKPRDPTDSELFYYRRREYKDTHKEQP
mgnify:CR=1 FL=1